MLVESSQGSVNRILEKRSKRSGHMIHTSVAPGFCRGPLYVKQRSEKVSSQEQRVPSDLELERKLAADVQISINVTKRLLLEAA